MAEVISGVGMHPFGRFADKTAIEMGVDAVLEALQDAGLRWVDIEAVYCGHMYAGTGAGHRLAAVLGRTGIPIINVENACSSGGAVVQQARAALRAGQFSRVLAVGLEKMPRGFMVMDYFEPWRRASGHAVNPAQFAMAAQRHMHEHGTTPEQLAVVASKNHRHSVHNDRAMYRRPIEVAEVLASPMITDPLRLLMLCAPNEGAAAAVLESRPARIGEVRLLGAGLRTATREQSIGEHMPISSPISSGPVARVTELAAKDAYTDAGLGPSDIDVAEVQDTDSGTEIIATEDLGFCAPGEGGRWAASGGSSLGGTLPVNPSGGLLSKGEPVGASGLGQIYEIVNQLRGRCGARQVTGARIGLTHAMGAGGNSSVLILGAT
jgi:acetyl-CoA acetyltransferase